MKFKQFLRNGALTIIMASTLAGALAQPVQAIVDTYPDNVAIVQIVKDAVPNEDLAYLIQHGPGASDAKIDNIRAKINSSIEAKYGQEHIAKVKDQVGKDLKELSDKYNVSVSYSWATPKKIIEEYPKAKQNDSSVAYGSSDTNSECRVEIRLATDNHGRLFESSELLEHTIEEMSNRSNTSIVATLKETVGHEISHCVLQKQMKDPNFQLSFSKEFRETNPQISKALNEKINDVRIKITNSQLFKNSKSFLVESILEFVEIYELQKNKDFVDKISKTLNNENIKDVLPIICKKEKITKEQKKELIEISFEKTYGEENLNFMMKNYEKEIRTIFLQKIDDGFFWEDLSIRTNARAKNYLNYRIEDQIEKIVFLEKNQLGYARSEIPYYLNLFSKASEIQIIDILAKLPNKELYLDMFIRDLSYWRTKVNPFNEVSRSPQKKLFTEMISNMNVRNYSCEFSLEDSLSKLVLKNELDKSLKEKPGERRLNKV